MTYYIHNHKSLHYLLTQNISNVKSVLLIQKFLLRSNSQGECFKLSNLRITLKHGNSFVVNVNPTKKVTMKTTTATGFSKVILCFNRVRAMVYCGMTESILIGNFSYESSTNELPLSEINFSRNPPTPPDISPNSLPSNIASLNAQTPPNAITSTTKLTPSSTNFNPTIPHPNIVKHNSDTTSSPCNTTGRRQRHSLSGQMSYYKMLGFGGFSKKMATSTNSLFSTAVISGSSSAPNLRDMIPCTASSSVLEGFGGVPPIRPLETLHNALSLKQLDGFLEKMITVPLFKTPASSPPTPIQTPQALPDKIGTLASWSCQTSMSSASAVSSGGPSSPNISDSLNSRSDFSISLASNDGGQLTSVTEFSQMFQMLDDDLGPASTQFAFDNFRQYSEDKATAAKGLSFGNEGNSLEGPEDEEDEPTISTDNCSVTKYDIDKEMHQQKQIEKPGNSKTNLENVEPHDFPQRQFRVKKQISLYERDNSTELKKLSQDGEGFTRCTSSGNITKRWIDSTLQHDNYVSADDVSSTSFYIGRSPIKSAETVYSDTKTMSCMNLKSCITPGAVRVKEKFIEPPLRVAKSFHGNTSFLKHKCKKSKKMDAGVSTDSVFTRPASSGDIKHRFVTTKVTEFDTGQTANAAINAEKCDGKA
ncbi:Inositol hexakisphosphate and diphosphoinositol-pentakisphosphate kinase [Pseudolycoriella hygida]|uniref:Inositol hexakisphosphate and diphosphoinositol-pentakisphosphate kinase n=1 Tax=Pseudolycoriella hygida TaxID=35572 RepID=A0A9Q0MQL6_9DIPT|nr:Inositol hexakisphosphate and diphosphoinositol-pentakisphosphate kinase [Pseudolycoriella hygida]